MLAQLNQQVPAQLDQQVANQKLLILEPQLMPARLQSLELLVPDQVRLESPEINQQDQQEQQLTQQLTYQELLPVRLMLDQAQLESRAALPEVLKQALNPEPRVPQSITRLVVIAHQWFPAANQHSKRMKRIREEQLEPISRRRRSLEVRIKTPPVLRQRNRAKNLSSLRRK